MTPQPDTAVPIPICTLGGTIACTPDADGSLVPGRPLQPSDIQALAPVGTEVSVHPLRQIPSAALDFGVLGDVLELAAQRVAAGAEAVVVTMGTDVLEEAAFALDLLWPHPQPLIVTGAMRSPGAAGSDGAANLRAALLVAHDPQAAGLGCVVVLNDEVHAAWTVRKAHTSAPNAFRSSMGGPIGEITEDHVRIINRPLDRPRLRLATTSAVPPVALLTGCMGDDGRLLRAVPGSGYAGLVLQASGGGSLPPAWSRELRAVVRQMPVVYASRTGAGAVLQRSYGGAGAERDLIAMGVLPAGMLDAFRARILLQLSLAEAASPTQLRRRFAAFDTPRFAPIPP